MCCRRSPSPCKSHVWHYLSLENSRQGLQAQTVHPCLLRANVKILWDRAFAWIQQSPNSNAWSKMSSNPLPSPEHALFSASITRVAAQWPLPTANPPTLHSPRAGASIGNNPNPTFFFHPSCIHLLLNIYWFPNITGPDSYGKIRLLARASSNWPECRKAISSHPGREVLSPIWPLHEAKVTSSPEKRTCFLWSWRQARWAPQRPAGTALLKSCRLSWQSLSFLLSSLLALKERCWVGWGLCGGWFTEGKWEKKSSFQNLAISSTRFREWSHDYKHDIQPALLSLESGREGSRDGQRPGVSYPGPKPKLKHGSLMLYAAMQEGKSNGNRGVAVLNLEAASTWRDC